MTRLSVLHLIFIEKQWMSHSYRRYHRSVAHRLLVVVSLVVVSPRLSAAPQPTQPAANAKGTTLPRWRQPADPEPLLTAEYLELTVAREKGVMKVISVQKRAFDKPQVLLPRFRGRFEVRLLSAGGRLVDVVRFDLPLTGGAGDVLGSKLSLGVSARTKVRAPFDANVASATLYDSLAKSSLAIDLSRFRARPIPTRLTPGLKLLPRKLRVRPVSGRTEPWRR